MKKIFPAFCIAAIFAVFCISKTEAQVTAVGSNLLRIGSGETQGAIGPPEKKRYLEEIANARIFFENITLGLRYEMDDPSEVGQSFQGLRRRWIEYNKDKLQLQAGDVSALYGRGLTINAFESRPLNYDSWLDGVSGAYEYAWKKEDYDFKPSIGVRMIAGKLAFHDVVDTNNPVQNISARAVNTQIGFFGKKLLVGASFLQAFTNVQEPFFAGSLVTTTREVNQPEVYLNFLTGSFEGFFQFTEMRSNLPQVFGNIDSGYNKGKAFYGSLSYAAKEFGITLEYKNYQYFIPSPSTRNYTDYISKLPISNPPEVYKEFTYASLTRTTHSVNFDDELGFQVEVNITAIPEYTITLNAAASSRHNIYDGNLGIISSASVLPKFSGAQFYPFWEWFVEAEHEFGELDYLKVFAHRRSDVIVANSAAVDDQMSTTVGAKFQYQTTASQSFLVSFEHQWMKTYLRIANDGRLNNELLTMQYSFNPIITFGGIFDFSTKYEDAPRHFWPQGFISFRIGGSHTVLASYGAERAGLNCTGGICRFVPAFNGFRVAVTSQL